MTRLQKSANLIWPNDHIKRGPHKSPDAVCPSTWLLTSHKIGDNNQVIALAETLGWPYETKTIVHRENRLTAKLVYKQLLGVSHWPVLTAHAPVNSPPRGPNWSSAHRAPMKW